MNQPALIAIIAIIAVALLVGIWLTVRRKRSDHLRERFGDEYDRTVDTSKDRATAEAELKRREGRVDGLDIRPLSEAEHRQFAVEWRDVKGVFVDSPTEAVLHADRMLANMMKVKGYPMADFNRRFEDLTVDHGDVARHYRDGHQIVDRHGSGDASTEDLRQAMKHYEALYDHLVSDAEGPVSPVQSPAGVGADTNGDGRADRVADETNHYGRPARVAKDVDGDGDTSRVVVKAD